MLFKEKRAAAEYQEDREEETQLLEEPAEGCKCYKEGSERMSIDEQPADAVLHTSSSNSSTGPHH
jgi:hypothetical protein